MQILDDLEAELEKKATALQRATTRLLTELDWNLGKTDDGYEFRVYETATKYISVISRPTVSELSASVAKLFVKQGYLRIMAKGGNRFWAVSNLKGTTSKSIAKELRLLDRNPKFSSQRSSDLTVIYLDEDKDSFDTRIQPERFPLTEREQYKWGSGYVSIEDRFFGRI